MLFNVLARHQAEKFRQEPKRRALTVVQATDLTPHMRRIVLSSPELKDFVSRSPDDHIKLFFADPASAKGMVMRDYTPRRFDAARQQLTIDFALHEAGPATQWALNAAPGQKLEIGGPRGSLIVPDDFDYYLLIGDESALPSIGRRLEELRAGVKVTSLIVVDGPQDVQNIETRADWTPVWLFRSGQHGEDGALMRDAARNWAAPQGDGYVWIGAEARAARLMRDYMLEERGHPKNWLKASGYWVRGQAGAAEKFEG